MSDSLYIKEEFYAVGKIIGYRNMDLFVLDREQEREDEDSYDNHVDHERLLLLFDKAGFPVQSTNEYNEFSEYYSNEKETRTTITMANHYYGEGGEAHFSSFLIEIPLLSAMNMFRLPNLPQDTKPRLSVIRNGDGKSAGKVRKR